mmetsp:Transcript_23882/g.50043  ORF Transcript_23882/g.50043 Transcript_23882/m.50043 type:complete len:2077 (-) Transcript_23882:3538-9768(-)
MGRSMDPEAVVIFLVFYDVRTTTTTTTNRPVYPAVLTTFGPGKGSGASEFSVWAYLTRPRPAKRAVTTTVSTSESNGADDGNAPLPNLVTAHANSLRVYTILPHAGTLALTAVYDNLAGTICSLDVIPNGMGGGGFADGGERGSDDYCHVEGSDNDVEEKKTMESHGRNDEDDEDLFYDSEKRQGNEDTCNYDGLLLGFAGHPRLSLVYPSTPMVGGGCWNKRDNATKSEELGTKMDARDDKGINMGVGQGGVLLASSIVDLTPALADRSMGGMSYLEQDIIVCVNTSGTVAGGVDLAQDGAISNIESDPCVSVVLGGGVAIASFSLPKGSRPDEVSSSKSSSSWWRVASEPYILPLPTLSSKIRFDFGGGGGALGANVLAPSTAAAAAAGRGSKNQPATGATVGGGPLLGHGFGDILDIAFLSGYTEPTLVVLHSNPKRGGGRAWAGRLGRTAEITVATEEEDTARDDYGEEMDLDNKNTNIPETVGTGTKFGLTLTAISISIHQRRSVVLWSLLDSIPADAWNLVPHPVDGVLVTGVNTIVYVSMGGKIKSALAVNGFARIGCPTGLLPPTRSAKIKSRNTCRASAVVCLECNPSPLPKLALQLDGARVGFVARDVALVCLGNGSLYSLELHRYNGAPVSNFMSLSPLGYRVGGLGVASCLSVMAMSCHSKHVLRYVTKDEDRGKDLEEDNVQKKEDDEKIKDDLPSLKQSTGPKIQARGIVFVGSRMGDCSLLAFSTNEPIRLTMTDVDKEFELQGKRKLNGAHPDTSSSMSEPFSKHSKLEISDTSEVATPKSATDDENQTALSNEEILRLEEEELYRIDGEGFQIDETAHNIVSPTREDYEEEGDREISFDNATRRTARYLSTFRTICALDSLTGLGPLGKGVYGPVATCPTLTGQDSAVTPSSAVEVHKSLFSNAFASAARHYIMPCGFGDSGGLAVLTTPGRDNVGSSILCESDLCNMAGAVFGLPRSNLVLLGKSDGVGSIILRGKVGTNDDEDDGSQHQIEGFEEVDVVANENDKDNMEIDQQPSLYDASNVFAKTTLLAASEFGVRSSPNEPVVEGVTPYFCIFFVKSPELRYDPYSIIVMNDIVDDTTERELNLRVEFVHRIEDNNTNSFFNESNPRGSLSSVTPFVSKISIDGSISSVTFGCVWECGHASVYTISLMRKPGSGTLDFNVSESALFGVIANSTPDATGNEEAHFYKSGKIVSMDIISLPYHIFENADNLDEVTSIFPELEPSSSALSFPPDRLSMHGTWFAPEGGNHEVPPQSIMFQNKILVAICRRSGSLEMYDNHELLSDSVIMDPAVIASRMTSENSVSPMWQAQGCGHGASVLGQSSPGIKIRSPEFHDVEATEIRFFVCGPSLRHEILSEDSVDEAKDAWMLRSLCILIDTNLGDLQLYSGSKRRSNQNRLEFSRVPLSNVSRPSDEAGRHLIKLRRKGIVSSNPKQAFRPNRLHRFCGISGQDGLFAGTPRPLWFVSERGAPTAVSHKSRHVSPAGGRTVPVSGFCSSMPAIFENASNGFITLHERIGRVGSQRLTLYSGLSDVFAPHGLLPGGGLSIQKIPMGVTVRHIEFIDDASISTTSRPMYVLVISREVEAEQSHLNDDGLSPNERQRIRDEKEKARTQKQVEADLGGFDIEQEWVEEIEREDCFEIDLHLGLAPPMIERKYEVWLVDASSRWSVVDKYELGEFEHGTALSVLYLTDVVEDSDETPKKSLFVAVGTSVIEPDGEDIASQGRILLFQLRKKKHWVPSKGLLHPPLEMVLKSEKVITLGPITSLVALQSEDISRVVVGAGAEVTIEQWGGGKLTQVGFYHAHMQVQEITIFKTFFLLSDAYDSLHFLVWRESDKSLTLLAKDYEPTQVFAAGLISRGGAMAFVCHDERQNLQFFQYAPTDAAARGGNKLVCRADYHLGSQTTALKSYWGQSSLLFNSCTMSSTMAALKQQDALFGRLEDDQRFAVNFGTTDGSFGSIIPLSEPTYWRLTALQSVMSNALESNCALSHRSWRLYRRSTRRGGCRSNDRKKGVVDADLVMKFVDLPLAEQEDLASSIGSTVGLVMDNLLELGCAGSAI